ncbi:DNA-processing protein DprA [Amnibacterium sp.]|uniref:DNA-processing protein DprA n=1 Tax=Amnibacterium sp. TaxID=1872496 RepID=UPI002624A6CC|nr:DNA-processing protein DprA [Amnibacterium sp.]MCU1474445.1 processing protein DprA [Amnibacterium sp.]
MSATPGFGEAVLRAAVDGVRADVEDDRLAEVFALGAWTGIAEPGDGVAGAFLAAFGAADALAVLGGGVPPGGRRELLEAFDRWRPRFDPDVSLRVFRNAAHLGIRLLLPGDDVWPEGLDDLRVHAPLALWCLGDPDAVRSLRRSIALVGARAATGYGERVAADAAAGLADRGFSVLSGAAYGIDGAAHRAALASGGTTVAVLAGGLDRFYPSGHEQLLRRIAAEGAVLAELPCGFAPTKWRFLQRNRLIAAASRATVVLEAGARSGSLNTAGHAAALGRPLGAVPGSVYSATSAGCHRLLREYDAVCVRDAADMAELVADATTEVPLDGLEPPADPAERRVLDALGARTRRLDDVARRAGLSTGETASVLALLALGGGAVQTPDGGWRRGR